MSTAIVNGITRNVPKIKACTDIQFAFKSRNQMALFLVWRVWYNEYADIEFARVLFKIGI